MAIWARTPTTAESPPLGNRERPLRCCLGAARCWAAQINQTKALLDNLRPWLPIQPDFSRRADPCGQFGCPNSPRPVREPVAAIVGAQRAAPKTATHYPLSKSAAKGSVPFVWRCEFAPRSDVGRSTLRPLEFLHSGIGESTARSPVHGAYPAQPGFRPVVLRPVRGARPLFRSARLSGLLHLRFRLVAPAPGKAA